MGFLDRQKMVYVAYTDGSCRIKERIGGWAARIFHQKQETILSGSEIDTTNNRMEMMAAYQALLFIPIGCAGVLYTDSKYLCHGMTLWVDSWTRHGWKTRSGKEVLNRDLWEGLVNEERKRFISWNWVKGHHTNEHNIFCDEVATRETRLRVKLEHQQRICNQLQLLDK
jgi:ribonuclease HI